MLNIKCSCVNNDEVSLEVDKVDKVVCLADGRVLEFSNKQVVGCCKIPYVNPSEIAMFFSYDPFIKYYLITQDDVLIVLNKVNQNLQYFRTYENVEKYEVGDFLVIGRPQVKIFLLDDMEPFITDFSNTNLCSLNKKEGSQRFPDMNRKLHMMRAALVQLNNISEDKNQIKESYFNELSSVSNSLIIFKEPWQRIVNGYWVICVCVQNNYNYDVSNLQFLVHNDITKKIRTKVCSFMPASKFLCSRNKLPSSSVAYIVGIMNEPNFNHLGDTVSLDCSLLYSISNDDILKDLRIPPFMFRTESLFAGNLCVFNSEKYLLQDIITCIAIQETTLLEIHFKPTENDKLIDGLMNRLNFIKFQINNDGTFCYYTKSYTKSMLSGLILFIEKKSEFVYSFVCYSKDVNQVASFKRFLELVLKTDLVRISLKKTSTEYEDGESIISAVNILDEEFKHFTSAMRNAIPIPSSLPIKDDNNLKFTLDTWKSLLESRVQLETDVEFQNAVKRVGQ